ncbi:hypothetical protein B0H19DRAFT_1068153 [Mycena capillaripes]|nr:hypothetical protein B0H19DRAFT_1068153 [Mycena capillaripes]
MNLDTTKHFTDAVFTSFRSHHHCEDELIQYRVLMGPVVPLTDDESASFKFRVAPFAFALLRLPQELVLLILDFLPESELLKLCEVSSESQQLALLTLLARHGVSESQIQSQELSKVTSPAIRSFDGDVDHLRPWRSLVHLAERFPLIPCVTFTFSDRSTASERFSGLWNLLPTTLIAFMGTNISRTVVLINYLSVTAVQPKLPNLLKRAWKTPRRRPSMAVPVVDRMKLTRKLLSSIATATTRRVLSTIYLRSFTEPHAPLGALLILNPGVTFYLDIGEHILSSPEWQFLLAELHLPSLRTLFIRIDFEHHVLSDFLERHNEIEHLEFVGDWSSRILQAPNELPLLEYVGIGAPESSADDTESRTHFWEALRAVTARSSVTILMLNIQNIDLPWADFDAKDVSRVEKELHAIQELRLSPWTREAEKNAFPAWLAMFPGLHDLSISGSLFQQTKGPLVSDWLVEAVNAACPHIVVKQERHL